MYFIAGYLVIKTIAYFPSQCALNSKEVMTAFLDSCKGHGWSTKENSMDADAVVLWSVLWHGRMIGNKTIYDHYSKRNCPIFVIDVGALLRGSTWKIALGNINAAGYYGHTVDLDWDRPKKIGLALADYDTKIQRIVIAAQHKRSLQVSPLPSLEVWITQQINALRQYCDLPIYVRPHPRCKLDWNMLPKDVLKETPIKIPSTYDDFDLSHKNALLVNYNSGAGIQAGIRGSPVIVDSSSLAFPISIKHDEVRQIPIKDRQRWFVEICHTEYTVEEIRQGQWLKRIQSGMK